MGASDIRAGGAYVEIGARTQPFEAALSKCRAQLESFGTAMTSHGAKLAGVGAGMLAPLAMASKAFADYGENIGKLSAKTGMASEFLAGLRYGAEAAGVSMGSVAGAVKGMQRAIADPSKEAAEAFGKLGLSAKQLSAMTPEEQFKALADAVAGVGDPTQRAALASQVFGRAGAELLPILDDGARGLDRMGSEARKLGLVLGSEATESARRLDDAFDRLEGSMKGALLQTGAALAPVLEPLVQRITEVVVAAGEWIKQNPEMVQSFAQLGVVIAGAGAAFMALGIGITVAMSPAFLITAAIVAIGSACLAMTDTLGVTATGFGDLFNAIRVDGWGLATWMSVISTEIGRTWDNLLTSMQNASLTAWAGIIEKVRGMLEWLISAFANVSRKLASVLPGGDSIVKLINAGEAGAKVALTGAPAMLQSAANANSAQNRAYNRLADQDVARAFGKDSFGGGTGVDMERLKSAFVGIGDKAWESLSGVMDKILGNFEIPKLDWGKAGQKPAVTMPGAQAAAAKFGVAGTFNAAAAGGMAFSGGPMDKIAAETKKVADNTGQMNSKMDALAGSYV